VEAFTRHKVRFPISNTECVAWHYPGDNGACVVMAPGFGVIKEAGTDRLARRFVEAGFSVVAFDYRRFGESGGKPRQLVRIGDQLEDWQAAIRCARSLPEVDPDRIAIWGFSLSGGHVFPVAARNPDLAAAISHSGLGDGIAAFQNARRFTTLGAMLRLTGAVLLDLLGGLFGQRFLIPLTGRPGTVASITTPDSLNGDAALNPGNCYPQWQREVAAASAIRLAFYRPGREARKVQVPLLVLAYEDDGVAPPGPVIAAAEGAPRGEVVKLPGGHYQAFLGGLDQAVEAMLRFLRGHLLQKADERSARTQESIRAA